MITTHPECVHEVQFFGTFFSKKKDFLFFGSGQQLTLYACAGGIACASQQIGESSKLCREGRKQSQAEHACVIFGQLFFFCFCRKMHVQLHTDVFLLAQKANAQRESFPRTCNHPAPTNTSVHHTSTQIHILADDGSFWNAGTHPKTFKTLKVK